MTVAPPSPTRYTSPIYGYTLAVPAGWHTIDATAAWTGSGASSHDVPEADQFVSPGTASSWALAAPTDSTLDEYTADTIELNASGHSSTCPPEPEINEPIDIGGEPGTLLGYNCGILINLAVTVHEGTGYLFGFRDPAVHAATDPTDRATFEGMLTSMVFPAQGFTSEFYGYSVNSPDWTGTGASTPWDGAGSPGDGDPTVDVLLGPRGVNAFATGVETSETLDAFAQASREANAAVRACPVKPASTKHITVGGEPAILDTADCDVFAMSAYVVHNGAANVFFTYGASASEDTLREQFLALLDAVSFH